MIFNKKIDTIKLFLVIIVTVFLAAPVSTAKPKLAIILDDFGYSSPRDNTVADFARLNAVFSISIIPHTPFATEIDSVFNSREKEIIIHFPLESYSRKNEEKSTLLLEMNIAEVKKSVRSAIENVPHAVGISNHQGSAFTSDSSAMDNLSEAMYGKVVYFIDSITSPRTVACKTCRAKGIPAFNRDIFLDCDIADGETIIDRFSAAVKIAEKHGYVIAVGHKDRTTYEAFREFLQSPLSSRVELVYPSQILHLIK